MRFKDWLTERIISGKGSAEWLKTKEVKGKKVGEVPTKKGVKIVEPDEKERWEKLSKKAGTKKKYRT
jgi:hypothetical protein